jgi:ABC-type Fe3+/spermidine/putrescine transport system ATPase subunit
MANFSSETGAAASSPEKRIISMVFPSYALFSHMTLSGDPACSGKQASSLAPRPSVPVAPKAMGQGDAQRDITTAGGSSSTHRFFQSLRHRLKISRRIYVATSDRHRRQKPSIGPISGSLLNSLPYRISPLQSWTRWGGGRCAALMRMLTVREIRLRCPDNSRVSFGRLASQSRRERLGACSSHQAWRLVFMPWSLPDRALPLPQAHTRPASFNQRSRMYCRRAISLSAGRITSL